MNLSDNLKKIRKDNNLSQEQLAEKLGVSRQSVSKWESGLAYPEMDKVLQLCKIFNLNIDELLNQDVKEINDSKQAKNSVNKFIDDFLDYITKTVDMFSSMNFKSKLKCIFEQLLIALVLVVIFAIIGLIGSSLISILSFLPDGIYYILSRIFFSAYLVLSLILGIILLLHIFKTRYLDYYIIVKDDSKGEMFDKNKDVVEATLKEDDNDSSRESQKVYLEKKKEKIIIRDPDHSGYKFISGLLKVLLFAIKIMAVGASLFLCLSLIFLVAAFIVSFMFIKTGLLFLGGLFITIACLTVNVILLIKLYNFIRSKKYKKDKLALLFMASLIIAGIGIGMVSIGVTKFDIVDGLESKTAVKKEYTYNMRDNLYINNYYQNIKLVESDNQDLRIVCEYTKYYVIEINEIDNGIFVNHHEKNYNQMSNLRRYIKDINNNEFIDYANYKVTIYTTKENIKKLEDNRINHENTLNENERLRLINEYEKTISDLRSEIQEKDNSIMENEDILAEKNQRISELEIELESLRTQNNNE